MAGQDSQADIEQTFHHVPQHKKQDALALLLRHADAGRSIVFCNTKTMVDDLDAVINFDLPQSFEYYVHRIGRTGRAGKQGVSQTLVCNGKQMVTLKALMRFTGSTIKEHHLPTAGDMMERTVAKEAAELLPQLQQTPGKAAQLLVSRLMGTEGSGITAEQVACALAEKLLGGDEKFASVKELEASPRQSLRTGKPSGFEEGSRSPMVTVTASIGRSARITPNHLVGSIAELLDIPGSEIGKIDIKDESTHIGLREDDAYALAGYGTPIRIKGAVVTFEVQKRKNRPYTPSFKGKKASRVPQKGYRKVCSA